jgi:hypothetical protein
MLSDETVTEADSVATLLLPAPSAVKLILDPPDSPPLFAMPQPLPPALAIIPDAVSSSPQALAATHTAYQVCLTAEAFNWNAITAGRDIALVRLVGWMMQKSPTAIARESITQEVLAAPMPHKVRQLGSYYSQYFVRICAPSTFFTSSDP